jgi:DNA-binding CsgD family transcriptional regulator
MPLPPPERLSDLIGSIYDCVLDRERWPATLTSVFREIGCTNAALTVHDARTAELKMHVGVGMDDQWVAQGWKYGASMLDIWGGQQRISSYPLEEPIVQSQATPRSTWLANDWYREMCLPRRLHDCIGVALVRDSRTLGAIAFGVHEDLGEVSDDTLAGVRLIAPHLRRAVTIGRLFEQEAAAAADFGGAIDAIAAGVVLVDEQAEIVHSNVAAETMLKGGDPICGKNGRLSTSSPVTSTVLAEAISQAARSEAELERRSIDIPARHSDGTPTAIQVMPLQRRSPRGGLKQRAAAAVFVANSADPPRLPGDALALLYKLTPAEVKVFELVVEGRTPAEIASLLALKLATVRTHLSRVFEKTGCARQADLVALASKITLPV